MKIILNIVLLISFIVTIMAPLTGVHVHKMATVLFLLLSIVHTIVYRKKLGAKRWLLLALIVISFATGLFGMILDHLPIILILHRCISIALVFFLAIYTNIRQTATVNGVRLRLISSVVRRLSKSRPSGIP